MPSKPKSDGNRASHDSHKDQNDSHPTEEGSMSNQEDFASPNEIRNEIRNEIHNEIHNEADFAPGNSGEPAETESGTSSLSLKVSKALKKRLEMSARDEGVTVQDLASELLAEGLVLRAWEIVERKSAMRGGAGPAAGSTQQHQQHQRQGNVRQGHSGGGGNSGGSPNRHGGGGSNSGAPNRHGGGGGGRMNKRHANHAASLNVMEDKAAFLEYVRNQERKNHNR